MQIAICECLPKRVCVCAGVSLGECIAKPKIELLPLVLIECNDNDCRFPFIQYSKLYMVSSIHSESTIANYILVAQISEFASKKKDEKRVEGNEKRVEGNERREEKKKAEERGGCERRRQTDRYLYLFYQK